MQWLTILIMLIVGTTQSFLRKSCNSRFVWRRYLNRLLLEASEVTENSQDKGLIGHLREDDPRCKHVKEVLKLEPGDSIKCGIINVGMTDRASILDTKNGIKISLGNFESFMTVPRPKIDLILAAPRPLRLEKIIPAIACFGVNRIIITGAARVEKAYLGSHLFRNETAMKLLLMDGLAQSAVDYHLPQITVYKQFYKFLHEEIDYDRIDNLSLQKHYRFIAHPPYPPFTNNLRLHTLLTSSTLPSAATMITPMISSDEAKKTPSPSILKDGIERITVAIGPEGGWLDEEIECFQKRGFQLINMGDRILRTDLAVSVILGSLNEFLATQSPSSPSLSSSSAAAAASQSLSCSEPQQR